MKTIQAAIIAQNSITLMIDGQTTPIASSHTNYEEIRGLAAAGNYAPIASLLDMVQVINDFGKGRVTVENGEVLYDGKPTHNAVTSRILQMVEEGLEVSPMVAFLDNLMDNPSFRSVQQLYGFLEVNDLPITEDGFFLAYKMCAEVNGKLTDIRTQTFDYSVGAKPAEMPRNEVNEDPDQTCSSGLHVCAQGYLGSYSSGEHTILVKVNPADVVAVPTDYNNAKMRVSKHETVCKVTARTRGAVYTSAVYTPSADSKSTLVNGDDLLTLDEAVDVLGLKGAKNPIAALRKRLSRAKLTSNPKLKSVFKDGVEMIQIIQTEADDVEVADDSVMTHVDAIAYFAKQNKANGKAQPADPKAALRKMLNRESACKRVYVDGVEMIKIL